MFNFVRTLSAIAKVLYYPIYFFGHILWYIARFLLAISYFIMLIPQPGIDIFKNFWK